MEKLKKFVAKVAGASEIQNRPDMFRIGKRNYASLRKMLWRNRILISGEDVGGSVPRTLIHYMGECKTFVRKEKSEYLL